MNTWTSLVYPNNLKNRDLPREEPKIGVRRSRYALYFEGPLLPNMGFSSETVRDFGMFGRNFTECSPYDLLNLSWKMEQVKRGFMIENTRTSEEMKKNGFIILPFPKILSSTMKTHIAEFMEVSLSSFKNEEELHKKLTEKSLSYSDVEFTEIFAKPFRMFSDAIAYQVLDWVNRLTHQFGGKQAGINYVCLNERKKNLALREHSYDVFWRCVRPGKPDVGAAHCDYQFWEIVKGTSDDVECPFDYNERWKIWLPLLGCDLTNSLQVVPGSHSQEIPTDRIMTKNGYKPVIKSHWLEQHETKFICPLTSFGGDTCVLFHDKLVHRGPPNQTSGLRLSGEFTILLKL